MIKVVSFSKNGDSIEEGRSEWFYYPRYSDRMEAIGVYGIIRCY